MNTATGAHMKKAERVPSCRSCMRPLLPESHALPPSSRHKNRNAILIDVSQFCFLRMVRGLTSIALWSLVNTATATNANVITPIIDLGYAQYQGYLDPQTNITNFLSIRYAAPPLGQYRPYTSAYADTQLRKPEVSATSATGPRAWCTTRDTEPRHVLSSRIWYQHDLANLTIRIQQTAEYDANCFGRLLVSQVSRRVPTRSRNNYNLNPATSVFVPGTMPAEPVAAGGLPVLVWIHGGGYASHPHVPECVSDLEV